MCSRSSARKRPARCARHMCFDLDSAPPVPVISGAAVTHRDLELDASDGNRFAAFAAEADEPSGAGVVILPDVRGLYRFYEELALRFAERGDNAVAFDYFGRTAGAAKRGDDFEYTSHVQATTREGIDADVSACVGYLREHGSRSVFTVGFCFGGRQSWLTAASGHGLSGAIGFYGRPGPAQDGSPGPIQVAGELECPVLGLMGGADEAIPQADVDAFNQALTEAGVEYELIVYPGAPHSFFDRKYEEHAEASEDAWGRVLAFIDRHQE
jgi:carboxymethylenebutenolidase